MEVAEGIHRIEVPLGDRILCLYLLVGSRSTLLVDSGIDPAPQEVVIPYIAGLRPVPESLRYVVITHCDVDHMGGNASIKQAFPGAILMCHELDRVWAEDVDAIIRERYEEFADEHGIEDDEDIQAWFRSIARAAPMDISVCGGETINLGDGWRVEVLHTPGHSRGHLSVYDPRSRALMIGDAVLGRGMVTVSGSLIAAPGYRHVDSYQASIEMFMAMEIDLLLTAHYPVYRGDQVTAFLGDSRDFVKDLDAVLKSELAKSDSPRTTRTLIDSISGRIATWPQSAYTSLAYPLVGHLERLERDRVVSRQRRDGRVHWQWEGQA